MKTREDVFACEKCGNMGNGCGGSHLGFCSDFVKPDTWKWAQEQHGNVRRIKDLETKRYKLAESHGNVLKRMIQAEAKVKELEAEKR
jgi:hypothetical protein